MRRGKKGDERKWDFFVHLFCVVEMAFTIHFVLSVVQYEGK